MERDGGGPRSGDRAVPDLISARLANSYIPESVRPRRHATAGDRVNDLGVVVLLGDDHEHVAEVHRVVAEGGEAHSGGRERRTPNGGNRRRCGGRARHQGVDDGSDDQAGPNYRRGESCEPLPGRSAACDSVLRGSGGKEPHADFLTAEVECADTTDDDLVLGRRWNADRLMPPVRVARQPQQVPQASSIPGQLASAPRTLMTGPEVLSRLLAGEGHDVVDVDAEAGEGPHEVGVTEGEDAAVVADHPVALARRGGHDADDVGRRGPRCPGAIPRSRRHRRRRPRRRCPPSSSPCRRRWAPTPTMLVTWTPMPGQRSHEAGVAEGEDAAVGPDHPVALAVGGGHHAPRCWTTWTLRPGRDPTKPASPKAKTPPSVPTIQ